MPPSRFAVSPYKNALPIVPDRSVFYPDLPLPSDGISPTLIRPTQLGIIATSASLGGLFLADWEKHLGKPVAGQAPRPLLSWSALGGKISCLDAKDGTVAVGGQGGVNVWVLPPDPNGEPSLLQSFSLPSSIIKVLFHPANPAILLVSTNSTISVFDLSSTKAEPRIQFEASSPKGILGVCFSWDGKLIGVVAKDGTVGVYDPRAGGPPKISAPYLNVLKQASIVAFGDQFLISGFSKSRERQILLFDPSDISSPVGQTTIDYETAPLVPIVDQERRTVYLAGRSENTIRYAEISKNFSFTWGAVGIPSSVITMALAPAGRLNVMDGEINRLMIVDRNKEIVPVAIKIPKRHYIEFHTDIFPPVRPDYAAQSSEAWFSGQDALPLPISLDPAVKHERPAQTFIPTSVPTTSDVLSKATIASEKIVSEALKPVEALVSTIRSAAASVVGMSSQTGAESNSSQPKNRAQIPSKLEDTLSEPKPRESRASSPTSAEPLSKLSIPTPPSVGSKNPAAAPAAIYTIAPTVSSAPSPPISSTPIQLQTKLTVASPVQLPSNSSTSIKPASGSAQSTPRWSRNFLQGSSHLIPTFDNLSCLSTAHPADSYLLQVTSSYLFFPIAGSGGRLAIQPMEKRGRLPLVGDFPHFANGSDIVDFAVDPIGNESRVAVAGVDGGIKIWEVPQGGVELGTIVTQPETVLDCKTIDKVAKLVWNPLVKNVLAVLSNDSGAGRLHVFGTSAGNILMDHTVSGSGVWTGAWNDQGSLIAVACKDRKVRVFDPRRLSASESGWTGPAHDSARGFQLAWLTDRMFVSVGFAQGSQRKILVHSLKGELGSEIEVVTSFMLDVSPSVLFPKFDADTSILYLWGKGETSISAFDIKLDGPKPALTRLPTFAGPMQNAISFLPKSTLDVRKVEVAKGYRLTPRTIEEFTFKIPRKNMDAFQDDVYPPTRDWTKGSELSAWMNRAGDAVPLVDLRPEGMKLASEAPVVQAVSRGKPQFGKREPTTAEKAKASMDAMFARAKLEDEENDEKSTRGDEEWSD
ncbi:Tumor-specific antigen (contains WD repeats) [Phaffia rhodozyma]|uniref:Tumor-specific antigen (Contains WD repeats) n=1 Tax=Phaffia rhodozyma TaxID=264483 RepID=A0A0F7SJJ4_PHARH|nr:Tumor-specific antigen (contains WD repeats) [Phaffia rhodozyma]